VQNHQLLTEGEVLEDEFLSTVNGGDDSAEKVSKALKHQRILANSGRRRHAAKLLALRTHGILTSHTRNPGRNSQPVPRRRLSLSLLRNAGWLGARCMLVGTQDGEIEILLNSFSDKIRKRT